MADFLDVCTHGFVRLFFVGLSDASTQFHVAKLTQLWGSEFLKKAYILFDVKRLQSGSSGWFSIRLCIPTPRACATDCIPESCEASTYTCHRGKPRARPPTSSHELPLTVSLCSRLFANVTRTNGRGRHLEVRRCQVTLNVISNRLLSPVSCILPLKTSPSLSMACAVRARSSAA